jgi:FMN phosphatase YigB (HAD superfamily)
MMKNKVKTILFFFDPWVEMSSDFRYGDFLHTLESQIAPLIQEFSEIRVACMVSDNFLQVIRARNPRIPEGMEFIELPYTRLWQVYGSYLDASVDFLAEIHDAEKMQELVDIVKTAAGDFIPDVILMHESHAPYLDLAWPESMTLHGMFGVTHRAPFPRTNFKDPHGLYSKSSLNVFYKDIIDSVDVDEEDRALIGKIRSWYAAQILPHDPVWRHVELIRHKFDKLVLLPLQVDNYFAFNGCSAYKNQLDFLQDVFAKLPRNWGVIVTTHGEYASSLDKYLQNNLRKEHQNYVFFDELLRVPTLSSCLLAHVDCVVSVSSSIALQAAVIYDIPVIAAGKSHINCVATCDLDNAADVFDIHDFSADAAENRLKVVKFILSRYTLFTDEQVSSPHWLVNYITKLISLKDSGAKGLEFFAQRELKDFYVSLKGSSQWRAWDRMLQKLGVQKCPHPVLARIPFYDAVSWDMFDTLVDRPFVEPHELFQLMERPVRKYLRNIYFPYHHLRREAERRARQEHGNRVEVTLKEIYEMFGNISGLGVEKVEYIKNLELVYERQIIRPRADIAQTWRLAKVFGKHRSVITDIYLEQDFIEESLRNCGYDGWDELFVSSEWRTRKDDGTIYPSYIEAVSLKFDQRPKFLHIGDNPRADRDMATPYGIDSVVIPKSMDVLKSSGVGSAQQQALRQRSCDTSVVLGLQASRRFSRSQIFTKNSSWSEDDLFNIGYSVFGPMIVGYTQWLIRRLKAGNIDKAYFLARDGYLIMKAYERFEKIFKDLPASGYLLCSRRSVMVSGIQCKEDIEEIATLNFGVMEVRDFLRSRFGVDYDEVSHGILRKYGFSKSGATKIRFPQDLPVAIHFCNDISDLIYAKARQERGPYLEYLKGIGFFEAENPAFVDIGYSGTMQRKIEITAGKSVSGFYMFTHNYVLDYFSDKGFEAWIAEYDSQRSCYRHVFNDYIPLLESFLSSEAGSFVSINPDQSVNYLYASNESDRCAFIRQAHAGVLAYVDDFIDRFGSFALDTEISTEVSIKPMEFFGARPSFEDVHAIRGVVLENMFAGAEFDLIANPVGYVDANNKISEKNIEALVSRSKWKTAARIYYLALNAKIDEENVARAQKVPGRNKQEAAASTSRSVVIVDSVQLSSQERLRRKFERDPKRFFLDSKSPIARGIGHLYRFPGVARQSDAVIRRIKGWN